MKCGDLFISDKVSFVLFIWSKNHNVRCIANLATVNITVPTDLDPVLRTALAMLIASTTNVALIQLNNASNDSIKVPNPSEWSVTSSYKSERICISFFPVWRRLANDGVLALPDQESYYSGSSPKIQPVLYL